jgi:hypothetical protein
VNGEGTRLKNKDPLSKHLLELEFDALMHRLNCRTGHTDAKDALMQTSTGTGSVNGEGTRLKNEVKVLAGGRRGKCPRGFVKCGRSAEGDLHTRTGSVSNRHTEN